MDPELTGNVLDIQRYTLHDGPGIRTAIFLQGCKLHCFWCHSPDSQAMSGELAWFDLLCVGAEKCGECLKVCPEGALTPGKRTYAKFIKEDIQLVELDREKCNHCMRCTAVCFPGALYNTCKKMSVEEIMKIIDKDKIFYHRSHGGVTFSGGEPMLQFDFLMALSKRCKEEGLHTALDTSGAIAWELYEQIADYTNLVLYDLKSMDKDTCWETTGADLDLILSNVQKFAAKGNKIQIRYPVITGINDDADNVQATASFCASLGQAVQTIQILPYHRLGIPKYARIGRKYELPEDLQPPTEETIKWIKDVFVSKGLKLLKE